MKFTSSELGIIEINLLSTMEADKLPDSLLYLDEEWWTRTPRAGFNYYVVLGKNTKLDQKFIYESWDDVNGVRPAIRINTYGQEGRQIGDKIELFGLSWTVIDDWFILCDSIVAFKPYEYSIPAPGHGLLQDVFLGRFLQIWLDNEIRKEGKNV